MKFLFSALVLMTLFAVGCSDEDVSETDVNSTSDVATEVTQDVVDDTTTDAVDSTQDVTTVEEGDQSPAPSGAHGPVVELAYTTDLKSVARNGLAGSSPAGATNLGEK